MKVEHSGLRPLRGTLLHSGQLHIYLSYEDREALARQLPEGTRYATSSPDTAIMEHITNVVRGTLAQMIDKGHRGLRADALIASGDIEVGPSR